MRLTSFVFIASLASLASATFIPIFEDPMTDEDPPPALEDVTVIYEIQDISGSPLADGRPIHEDGSGVTLAGPFPPNTIVSLVLEDLPEKHDALEVQLSFRVAGNWRGHFGGLADPPELDYVSFTIDQEVFLETATICTLDDPGAYQRYPLDWTAENGNDGGTACRANTRGGETINQLLYPTNGKSDAYTFTHIFPGHNSPTAEILFFGIGHNNPAQGAQDQSFFLEDIKVTVNTPDLFLGFLPIEDPVLGWAIVISSFFILLFSTCIIRKAIKDGREQRRFGGGRLSRAPKGYASTRSEGSRGNAKLKSGRKNTHNTSKGSKRQQGSGNDGLTPVEVSGPVIPGPNEVKSHKKRGASPKRKKSKARNASPNRKRKDKDTKEDAGIAGDAVAALEGAAGGDDAKHFTLNPTYEGGDDDTAVNLDSRADQKARLAELKVAAPLPSEQGKKVKVRQEGNI